MDELSFFKSILYEADEPPPDFPPADVEEPPDLPVDEAPDLGDIGETEAPPDINEDDEYMDDVSNDQENNNQENLELDEKISAIMNANLYQKYLSLLNAIGTQITTVKDKNDVLYTIASDSSQILTSLRKLDENIRIYVTNRFMRENYSKNLLFFNKCINLYKLLNDAFITSLKNGISRKEH